MQAGVDLFQGYHFAKPQLLSSKKEVASFAGVSKVLQLIMEDASNLHLEQALKNVPPLVVQVLRLANSGRSSRARQAAITSISQALSFVGSSQLARWCCLLMYGDSLDRSSSRDPIVTLVERRAGFMEQGAAVLRGKDREFCQSAWLTGLLSLVHVPNGADAASLIGQLPLDASIKDAIVERRGDLGTLLSIVESMEAGDFNGALAQSCSFGPAFKARLPDLGW
jgi:c-di-GMP-related signal transduction protein